MPLPVPFDDLDAMVGKTVSGYYENELWGSDRVYLFFTDDTVLWFERSGEDIVVGEVAEHTMGDRDFLRDMAEASVPGAKAALVTLEDELAEKKRARQEALDRQEYERLRAKYEPKEAP